MDSLEKVLDIAEKYNADLLLNFISPDGSALDSNMKIMSSEEKLVVYEQIAQYILDKGYNNQKFADIFFQRVRAKTGCGALSSTIVIFPDGNMYPCHSLEIPELRIGNITEDPLKLNKRMKEIYCSKFSQSLFNVKLKEPCKKCQLRFVCGGFCGANQYHGIDCDCNLQKVLLVFDLLFFDANKTMLNNLENFTNYVKDKKYIGYLAN
jgi:radical SAM protein with 4Fe4S-binding SPASM domain